jgi:hypothetical protein
VDGNAAHFINWHQVRCYLSLTLNVGKNQASCQQNPDFKPAKSRLQANKIRTPSEQNPDFKPTKTGLKRKNSQTETKKQPD